MDLLLITPPLLQLNAPYPATPVLQKLLRGLGYSVSQRDLSLELALRVFTPSCIRQAADAARTLLHPSDPLSFFINSSEDYARTVESVVSFLQGELPELAWRIAARTFLPEGPFFEQLDPEGTGDEASFLSECFGAMGTIDKAKFLASLYLDDLSSFLAEALDTDFVFGKYGERIALSLPSMKPLLTKLERTESTVIEQFIDEMTDDLLAAHHPRHVGLAVPFPGTLPGALRIARRIRHVAPDVTVILGGGYVNSELRSIEDRRIFNYVDYLCFDEGLGPLTTILQAAKTPLPPDEDGAHRLLASDGWKALTTRHAAPPMLVPDYDGLNLHQYLSVVEMPNPLHRIWSDGLWMKMQLAQGCYWHQCSFCDTALDYICRYKPANATDVVDAMENLMKQTGRRGFHFVDEALSPSLLRAVSKEIIRRGLSPVWWGNIRFDTSFTPELAVLMADAGCIAVTGGLECAHDRLLSLMNKGISLASAHRAFQAFQQAGILVHAYLMYGFPTETKDEVIAALDFVRSCFQEGLLQSAFWHRFALTAHSAIARNPQPFGITVPPVRSNGKRFALNEIPYDEPNAPNWDRIGKKLKTALYNFMLGRGLDIPAREWLS